MDYLFLLIGLTMIILGANWLVNGASSIAKSYGISDLVIGLTIVGFGTSAPELAINIYAAVKGSADIAIGNVLGSNIANILLILGVSAIIYPLKVANSAKWKEIPISLLAILVLAFFLNDSFFGFSANNSLSRLDGILLLVLMGAFLVYAFKSSKSEIITTEEVGKKIPLWKAIIMILIGLAGLFFGGQIFVDGAIGIARDLGMSERVIGLTIVAIGTSLPELATSVVAAMKKKSDIAVGNVIGSNIFNVFFILGTTAVISPLPFDPAANMDILVATVASLMLFMTTITFGRKIIDRIEGVIFLMVYVGYITYLIY
ncbi:MAG: sodium:proton exchanger [Bacteroidetes bacterium HGW-Bacteroidetes-21]|jgi:cation:H+ antiporter|nr:MAG: sodium:proton exchanger [Bacteroidetes bacterium HGW-Bacteroidetes-21]